MTINTSYIKLLEVPGRSFVNILGKIKTLKLWDYNFRIKSSSIETKRESNVIYISLHVYFHSFIADEVWINKPNESFNIEFGH